MAATFPSTWRRSTGRPVISTTTTGVPVAASASICSTARPGRSRVLTELFSPIWFWRCPVTIATSEASASSTARASSACVVALIGGLLEEGLHPVEHRREHAARDPHAGRVVDDGGVAHAGADAVEKGDGLRGVVVEDPRAEHVSLARGQLADDGDPGRGRGVQRSVPSLLSSTIVPQAPRGRRRGGRRGRGSRGRRRRRRRGSRTGRARTSPRARGRTAWSRAASSTFPSATEPGRWVKAGSDTAISMSRPALGARAPASAGSAAKCWVSSDLTALASLTTKPSKPHSSRSTSVSSQRFPDAGTPLRSM